MSKRQVNEFHARSPIMRYWVAGFGSIGGVCRPTTHRDNHGGINQVECAVLAGTVGHPRLEQNVDHKKYEGGVRLPLKVCETQGRQACHAAAREALGIIPQHLQLQ